MTSEIRVVLSTISKFHTFDLARQMLRLGTLERIFTGHPRWKILGEGLPAGRVETYPYLQTVWEGLERLGRPYPLRAELNWWCHRTLDAHVSRNLPPCDVFHALVYSGLASGRAARRAGAVYICDSPSPHMRWETDVMVEEAERARVRFDPLQERFLQYAEESYREADAITVPSEFARDSFVAQDFPASKLTVVPYGVDLTRFAPVDTPPREGFRVLFVGQVGVRKGVHDLVAAFERAAIPGSTLHLVGPVLPEGRRILSHVKSTSIHVVGPVARSALPAYFSSSDVLVLPSLSEGLALVLGQALACGCPVIATPHTGGAHLFTDSSEGFLVPVRSPDILAERLVWLSEHPEERQRMRLAALDRARGLRGWDTYGETMLSVFRSLTDRAAEVPA